MKKALTIEELKERIGKPVFVVATTEDFKYGTAWHILSKITAFKLDNESDGHVEFTDCKCIKFEHIQFYKFFDEEVTALELKEILDVEEKEKKKTGYERVGKRKFYYAINSLKEVDNQFDMWLLHKNGVDKFAKAIKKRFFTSFDISPYNRFFLIECDKNTSMSELKTIVIRISEKYSKLSQRAKPKFCPYFCFLGIEECQLIELKKSLANDSVLFSDGYDFKGADFNPSSIVKEPSKDHLTKLRIIGSIDLLNDVYALSQSTIEIYQFYKNQPLYNNDSYYHVKIPFENITDIAQMI